MKERPLAEQKRSNECRGTARYDDGNEAPWLPLEQKQFDREKRRRQWRRKRRTHARRGAGNEQCLAFCAREGEELRKKRPDSTSRHDDWALRTEGTSRPDGDRARDRL